MPGERHAIRESVREGIARARDLARCSAAAQAIAAELAVTVDDLCCRAHAECRRTWLLASGRGPQGARTAVAVRRQS